MSAAFRGAFASEWCKKKGSLAAWLIIAGAFFTPAIVTVARLLRPDRLRGIYQAPDFWTLLWKNSWESMAIFFLPMGAMLVTSLITQLEYRNNAWKQVHALPLSRLTIFFAKFALVLVMLAQFLALFNLGIFLSAIIPGPWARGVLYPLAPLPWPMFLRENGLYFIDCLPILALQYLLCLVSRNFLVPVGIGFLSWVAALAALSWKWGFLLPYTYSTLNFLKDNGGGKAVIPPVNFHLFAIGYFLLFVGAGFAICVLKPVKG